MSKKYIIACDAYDKNGDKKELACMIYNDKYIVLNSLDKCVKEPNPLLGHYRATCYQLIVFDEKDLKLAQLELEEQKEAYKKRKDYTFHFYIKKFNSAKNKYKLSKQKDTSFGFYTRTKVAIELYQLVPCK